MEEVNVRILVRYQDDATILGFPRRSLSWYPAVLGNNDEHSNSSFGVISNVSNNNTSTDDVDFLVEKACHLLLSNNDTTNEAISNAGTNNYGLFLLYKGRKIRIYETTELQDGDECELVWLGKRNVENMKTNDPAVDGQSVPDNDDEKYQETVGEREAIDTSDDKAVVKEAVRRALVPIKQEDDYDLEEEKTATMIASSLLKAAASCGIGDDEKMFWSKIKQEEDWLEDVSTIPPVEEKKDTLQNLFMSSTDTQTNGYQSDTSYYAEKLVSMSDSSESLPSTAVESAMTHSEDVHIKKKSINNQAMDTDVETENVKVDTPIPSTSTINTKFSIENDTQEMKSSTTQTMKKNSAKSWKAQYPVGSVIAVELNHNRYFEAVVWGCWNPNKEKKMTKNRKKKNGKVNDKKDKAIDHEEGKWVELKYKTALDEKGNLREYCQNLDQYRHFIVSHRKNSFDNLPVDLKLRNDNEKPKSRGKVTTQLKVGDRIGSEWMKYVFQGTVVKTRNIQNLQKQQMALIEWDDCPDFWSHVQADTCLRYLSDEDNQKSEGGEQSSGTNEENGLNDYNIHRRATDGTMLNKQPQKKPRIEQGKN